MKYLTPDLHVRLNLAVDEEAEQIEEEWEAREEQAQAHFAAIAPRLPDRLRRFATEVNLHDAELRGVETDPASDSAPGVAVLSLRQRNLLITLYYDLLEPPERTQVADAPTCAPEGRHLRGLVFEDEAKAGPAPSSVRSDPQAVWQTQGLPLWLYDEIDVLGDPADPSGFVHEILLSTGEVLRLAFFGFDWHVHDLDAAFAGMPTRR